MYSKKKKIFLGLALKGKNRAILSSWAMLPLFMMATWQYWQYSQDPSKVIGKDSKPSELSQIFTKTQNQGAITTSNLPENSAGRPFIRIKPAPVKEDTESVKNTNQIKPTTAIINPTEAAESAGFKSDLNIGQPTDAPQTTYNGYAPKLSNQEDSNSTELKPTYNGYISSTTTQSADAFGFTSSVRFSNNAEEYSNSPVLRNILSNNSNNKEDEKEKSRSSRLRNFSPFSQSEAQKSSESDSTTSGSTANSSPSNPWGQPVQTDKAGLNTTNSNNSESNSSVSLNSRSSVSLNQQSNRYIQNIYNYTYSGAGTTQNNSSSSYSYSYSPSATQTPTGASANVASPQSSTPGVKNQWPAAANPNTTITPSSNLPSSTPARSSGYSNPYSSSFNNNSAMPRTSAYTNPYSPNNSGLAQPSTMQTPNQQPSTNSQFPTGINRPSFK